MIYARVLTVSNMAGKNYIGSTTHRIESSHDLVKLAGYQAEFIFASIACEPHERELALVHKVGCVLASLNATMMTDTTIEGFCEIMSYMGFDVQRRML